VGSQLSKHEYSFKDIEKAAERAALIAKEINDFADGCRLEPPQNPQPIEISFH
jgi:hypothetical protein